MIFSRDRTMTEQGLPKASDERRFRRPGRPLAVLAAALVLAAGSYVVGPLLRPAPAPRPAVAPGVGAPGDVAPLTGAGAPGPAGAQTGLSVDDRLPIADRLAFWAGRVAARPDDFLSLAQLASVQAEQARLTVDLDDYQRALSDVAQSLADRSRRTRQRSACVARSASRSTISPARSPMRRPLLTAATRRSPAPRPARRRLDRARTTGRRRRRTTPDWQPHHRGPAVDVRLARLAIGDRGPDRSPCASPDPRAAAAPAMDPAETIGFYEYAAGEYARLAGDAATAPQPATTRRCSPRHRRRRARRPRSDRRVRWAHRATRSPASGGCRDRSAAGDAGAARRPAGGRRRSARRRRAVRDRPLHRAPGRDPEHRLRPPLLRFELDHGGATDGAPRPRAGIARRRDPTRPVTTRSPGHCTDSAGSTRPPQRSDGPS